MNRTQEEIERDIEEGYRNLYPSIFNESVVSLPNLGNCQRDCFSNQSNLVHKEVQTDSFDVIAIRTTSSGTKLSAEDIQSICNDVESGVPYRTIQRKYNIGGGRLTRILKLNNTE